MGIGLAPFHGEEGGDPLSLQKYPAQLLLLALATAEHDLTTVR